MGNSNASLIGDCCGQQREGGHQANAPGNWQPTRRDTSTTLIAEEDAALLLRLEADMSSSGVGIVKIDMLPVEPTPGVFAQQYVVGRLLGKGHYGEVMEVTEKATGEHFAVKIMADRVLEPEDREALKVEMAVLRALHHPNIMSFKEYFCGGTNELDKKVRLCRRAERGALDLRARGPREAGSAGAFSSLEGRRNMLSSNVHPFRT